MSILTSPDLILFIILEEEHEAARKAMDISKIILSEHIGDRYHYIVRHYEELPPGIRSQPAYRTGILPVPGNT
jgi:hypothetical protein